MLLAGRLVKAHVEGFQGKQLGPESVMCVARHFPGGGAVKDGAGFARRVWKVAGISGKTL